jgi:hypothetical protein
VQSKLAMLYLLAQRPTGRATLDELKPELEDFGERAIQTEAWGRFAEIEERDIVRSGLVVFDDQGLSITDAGRSFVRALEELGESSVAPSTNDWALKLIDSLIGAEQRSRIFDLGLRGQGESLDLEPLDDELTVVKGDLNQVAAQAPPDPEPKVKTPQYFEETGIPKVQDFDDDDGIDDPVPTASKAPAFLKRSLDSKVRTPMAEPIRRFDPSHSMSFGLKRIARILRGHLEPDGSSIKKFSAAGTSGVAMAILSLVMMIIGAGSLMAFNQIKSLKAEIASLERELGQIKKQAARLEALESKKDADQKDNQGRSGMEKADGSGLSRVAASQLDLSADEIRMIREFIKPAPLAGPPTSPSVNVGDSVTEGTIPIPSPLADKVPKLLGARFTIRNGTIVIIKRDSHQADAVLAPN